MHHTKYRVWLLSIALAALIFGAICYALGQAEEETVPDGTLVYQVLPAEEGRETLL